MSGWGCPHEVDGRCRRVEGRLCDPGMKGCVLFGRFVFSNPDKNRPDKNRLDKNQPPKPSGAPLSAAGTGASDAQPLRLGKTSEH